MRRHDRLVLEPSTHCTAGYLSMADNSVSLSAITATSAIVKWTKISNVPDGLQENYVYQVQYRQPHSEWKTSMSVSHDPGCASVQEIEVGDLEANQQYEVRLKSFRVVRGTWDAMTETVTVSFDTPCQGTFIILPSPPPLLSLRVSKHIAYAEQMKESAGKCSFSTKGTGTAGGA